LVSKKRDYILSENYARNSEMSNVAETIKSVLGSAPEDLVDFYNNRLQNKYSNSEFNILRLEKALEYSGNLKGIPIVDRLGLWAINDENDSNPFCYITKGPCSGAVIYFSHDPEPEIKFSSLDSFLKGLEHMEKSGLEIDEIETEQNLNFPLSHTINDLCKEDSEEAQFLLCTYMPVCNDLSTETKEKLLNHEDFFVREAFANWIIKNSLAENLPYAKRLANDIHPQVERPGKTAMSTVNRKKHGK